MTRKTERIIGWCIAGLLVTGFFTVGIIFGGLTFLVPVGTALVLTLLIVLSFFLITGGDA